MTIGGVPCTLAMDDPFGALEESQPETGATAMARFQCAWPQRYALVQGLIGTGRSTLPFTWPGSPNLKCLSIGTITGAGKLRILQIAEGTAPNILPAGWAAYDWAIVPANFGVLPYAMAEGTVENPIKDPSGQPWTTTRFRVNAEILQPPGGTFYYIGAAPIGGTPIDKSAIGITRPKIEISMTRHRVDVVQVDALMGLIGTLNDAVLTFADHVFDIGTLLFAGFNGTENFDSLGNMTYEVEYSVLGQDVDWNKIMAKDADFYMSNSKPDGSGREPFLYSDFADIP